MKKFWRSVKANCGVLIVLSLLTTFLFKDFIFMGKLPIPSDTMVGVYFPWRDEIWMGREAGFPVKNFTIRDVVRQLYPWRLLAINQIKEGQFPLWNPYNFTGVPHLANVFTAALYPFNLLFFLFSFPSAWSIYVAIQPVLTGLAFYFFLRNLKLSKISATLGSIVFAFSSFLMIRLEFGMVGHSALWLPLALFAIDKLTEKKCFRWWLAGTLCLFFSLLAGYLQVTIYSFVIFCLYGFYRCALSKDFKLFLLIISIPLFSFVLAGIQTIPLLEISKQSTRIGNYGKEAFFAEEYFLPWERLITFFVPDFFGNDAAGNFWGKTSYYEFTGYIGIVSLFFVFYSIFSSKKEKFLWWSLLIISFLFLLPTPIAKFFYLLSIPGLSILVPARILFIVNFLLALLSAFGLEEFKKDQGRGVRRKSFFAISFLMACFTIIIIIFLAGLIFWPLWGKNALVSLRNLVLPSFSMVMLLSFLPLYLAIRSKKLRILIIISLLFLLSFSLLRHSLKYNPFVEKEVLFPQTETINFLQQQQKNDHFRVQITHSDLLTPNINLVYGLEMVEGYDSVHSKRFEELAMAANNENPSLKYESPGRILFLGRYQSPLFDLMNVKYVLALKDIPDSKFKLVFQKGQTRVYENQKAYPRVYLTKEYEIITNEEKILTEMLRFSRKGERKVVLEEEIELQQAKNESNRLSSAEIIDYSPQSVKVKTQSASEEILVFSDAYDPGWRASIDGKPTKVYRANYNFRAVIVPEGDHQIDFIYQPKSFMIGLFLSITATIFLLLFSLRNIIKKCC